MERTLIRLPYFYTQVWFYLFDYIKKMPRKEALKKMLSNRYILNKESAYLEMTSIYLNDLEQIEFNINDDFFKNLNLDGYNEKEKKIIYIMASSIDLRINKNFTDVIIESIINEEKLLGKYSYDIAKYILKYMICRNKEYILKNIFENIFKDHIFYLNKKDNIWLVYVNNDYNEDEKLLIEYIKNYFIEKDENLKVFWKKHFGVISHNILSKIEKITNY